MKGTAYVFTSRRDAVLQLLVFLGGTADRHSGTTATIGVDGLRLPPRASSVTRRLYAEKIVEIPWKTEFQRVGNYGGHTDTVRAAFVERYVAPLVRASAGILLPTTATESNGGVQNPDYARWARFAPGSWVILEGNMTVEGVSQLVRVKATLIQKTATLLIVERQDLTAIGGPEALPFPQQLFVAAHIDPAEHPLTHPSARVEEMPDSQISAGGQDFACRVRSVAVESSFRDWGDRPRVTVYLDERVPGGIMQLDLSTRFGRRALTFNVKMSRFHNVPVVTGNGRS